MVNHRVSRIEILLDDLEEMDLKFESIRYIIVYEGLHST